jgi:hypothetical protein
MTSSKFVLIPQEVYQGLTSSDTGNINLDFAHRSLDKVKQEKTDPVTKNARYNQELRRYLHLRKEHVDKPVKVEVSGAEIPETKVKAPKTTITQAPSLQQGPKGDFFNEFYMRIRANPAQYNVTDDERIKNESGRVIEGSNVKKSLNWILSSSLGEKHGPRPKGTMLIEEKIKNDPTFNKLLESYAGDVPASSNVSPKTRKSEGSPKYFSPQSW